MPWVRFGAGASSPSHSVSGTLSGSASGRRLPSQRFPDRHPRSREVIDDQTLSSRLQPFASGIHGGDGPVAIVFQGGLHDALGRLGFSVRASDEHWQERVVVQ